MRIRAISARKWIDGFAHERKVTVILKMTVTFRIYPDTILPQNHVILRT